MIKTINLNGSEVKVSGPDGDNAEIHNFGADTVYASKFPEITADADNVIAVSAGAIDGLSGTGGTVYLLGTGKVQVNFTDEKVTRTAAVQSAANGAGTGVSKEYVDEKDSETLASAKEYADNKNAGSLTAAKSYADALNSDLSGYIGYTDSDIYGLEADFENNRFTRLAGAAGKEPGADFDSVRAYGGRRRCNLSDSGEVLAYYGDEDFKADGSNGQVMVEQPKFYYRAVPLKTEKIEGTDGYCLRKARYYISDTPKAGFKVHPAFVRNGFETDRIYLSAFEGSIYDVSEGEYLLNDEQTADFNADKLSSIAGAKPCSGQTQALTRANARKLAHNRGGGWEQAVIQAAAATQMLFVIEYAAFDSQAAIGMGNVSKTNDAAANSAEKTGATLPLGSLSGSLVNSENIRLVSYRGEENLWGNIYKWLDGINTFNPQPFNNGEFGFIYISDKDFKDNSSEGYIKTGIPACKGSGYISGFGYSDEFDWVFIPCEFKGNTSFPIGDIFYNSGGGWRTAITSGTWYNGSDGGLFCVNFNTDASSSGKIQGARITYFPQ